MLLFVVPQLVEKIEMDKQQREEMEQVRLELCLEQEEEANRQREIVSAFKCDHISHISGPCVTFELAANVFH